MFESYPQLILGIIIIQGLQIMEPLNIVSCIISAVSVLIGFGDRLSYIVNDKEAGAPLSVTGLGILATALDTLFRAIFLAYSFTIVKAYALLLVPTYILLMIIGVWIKKKSFSIC